MYIKVFIFLFLIKLSTFFYLLLLLFSLHLFLIFILSISMFVPIQNGANPNNTAVVQIPNSHAYLILTLIRITNSGTSYSKFSFSSPIQAALYSHLFTFPAQPRDYKRNLQTHTLGTENCTAKNHQNPTNFNAQKRPKFNYFS